MLQAIALCCPSTPLQGREAPYLLGVPTLAHRYLL